MTTINIQLTHACSGGNHFTFAITGDKAATLPLTRDEITQPITSDDVAAFMIGFVCGHIFGYMTPEPEVAPVIQIEQADK